MKKLILSLLCLLLPALALATDPTVDSHTINTAAVGGTSFTSAAITTTTGDTIVEFITVNGGTATITATDSKSNSCWMQPTISGLGNPVHESNDNSYLYVVMCPNITSGGSGHTFSVSISGNTLQSVAVIAVKNAASSPLDVSNSAYATSYPLSAAVSPAASGDLIIGVGMTTCCNSATTSPTGTGFVSLDSYSGTADFTSMGDATRASAPSGSNDPLMTNSHAGQGFAVMTLALKGSGGASCTNNGWNMATGAFSTPTAGSGTFWLKTGAKGSTDCSSTQYWQSGGVFGAN